MNKKFLRVISFILSVMMLFGCVITASAEDASATTEKITVTVRVEGLSKNLAEKEFKVDKSSTVKSIIDAAAINVVYKTDSLEIDSVKGERAVTASQWQYAVDNVIKTDAIDTLKIENDSEIVLFNAASDAVIPSISADEVALSGVVEFKGTDKNGTVAPIEGATVTWETDKGAKTYTTDANGKVYLAEDALEAGKHGVSISKLNAHNVPVVVRLADDAEVEVPELEDVQEEEKTLFEKVYDFLYSILKGVIEVWAFYFSEIGKLLGIVK